MKILLTHSAIILALIPTLSLAQPAKITTTPQGPALETPAGKTLYVYDADDVGQQSNCDKTCADLWPPYIAESKVDAHGDWSVVKRSDGIEQWAYKGRPLYTWSKDTQPHQESGNAFEGNKWHVAKP
jgi:predicted lipoprotein with Yx(FWY)xxD motif